MFTTGVTQDFRKAWANDAKSEDKPFRFLAMPADLAAALDKNKQSVTVKFTASDLKYSDGTEEKPNAKPPCRRNLTRMSLAENKIKSPD